MSLGSSRYSWDTIPAHASVTDDESLDEPRVVDIEFETVLLQKRVEHHIGRVFVTPLLIRTGTHQKGQRSYQEPSPNKLTK